LSNKIGLVFAYKSRFSSRLERNTKTGNTNNFLVKEKAAQGEAKMFLYKKLPCTEQATFPG